ncbi:rhomboid family intramembrane serine protease [Pontibacter sp. HSC-14F20]|uniref:rhomboid family intramembrane serine protease n=1 Tax=Pontibacter sp. HSC-14F20 TaxID=2864136 RepID=UPI001C739A6A|nr:rhomboid family intramembrane serine protease [Pontibacter sp. HSC-14F20]MBX0333706.1 rhomboid family intramembrane serine protease [Pontibacter sp. HSC-14F20]
MSVTVILIIITVGISMYAWKNHDLMQNWIFHPYSVARDNSWHRFLTSGFLHADYTHLFFNMFTLYFFGNAVEMTFGAIFGDVTGILIYMLIYLGGIIVSDIPTFLKHRDDPSYRALGASGGVASVVFSSILFYPTQDICLYAILCIPGFILGILYLMYSYFQGKRMGDNINHDAHFYGAVYGMVISLALVPKAGPLFIEQISNWRLPFL